MSEPVTGVVVDHTATGEELAAALEDIAGEIRAGFVSSSFPVDWCLTTTPVTRAWVELIEEFTRWKLSPWHAQTLVRLAASAVDSGTLSANSEGFSDPEVIDSLARRTWKAIAYLGDGEPGSGEDG